WGLTGHALRYKFRSSRARLNPLHNELRPRVNTISSISLSVLRPLAFLLFLPVFFSAPSRAQQVLLQAPQGQIAELTSSGPQRREGDLYLADGDVDIV